MTWNVILFGVLPGLLCVFGLGYGLASKHATTEIGRLADRIRRLSIVIDMEIDLRRAMVTHETDMAIQELRDVAMRVNRDERTS